MERGSTVPVDCQDDLQKQLGIRVGNLRKAEGLNQEQFAQRIGMDRSYFASIETGCRNVTPASLAKIANGFGMALSELFEGVGSSDSSMR